MWSKKINSPKLMRKLFSQSASLSEPCADRPTSDTLKPPVAGATGSGQQMSTSWEFLRPNSNYPNDVSDKDEPQDMLPPRFIAVQRGKISLEPPTKTPESIKDREVLEARIAELEDALARLQVQVNSQCSSPILEKELKEQLETMNKTMRTKDRRSMQACREHKTLQARFVRQENSLHHLSHENKALQQRVRQYEICLDDVMRKVVDAIVAEDSLREEVSMLKNRVRDLEAQNAVLVSTSATASPAKGKDEGYCTMSSGQPQPSVDSHLADLPEEPEQWLVSASGSGSAEMEDWSMSQEELGTVLDDDNSEWIWNTANFVSTDTQTEEIAALLQDQLAYSDDEEITCKDFTRDFYKLVNIKSDSTRSLQSAADADQSDSSSECGRTDQMVSPSPSEAGRAQVLSCTSSDSSEIDNGLVAEHHLQHLRSCNYQGSGRRSNDLVQDVLAASSRRRQQLNGECNGSGGRAIPVKAWRKSNGWRRMNSTENASVSKNFETSEKTRPHESGIPLPISPVSPMKTRHHIKSPPPVPVRRTHAS